MKELILLLLVVGCTVQVADYDPEEIAMLRVVNDYNYKEYNGIGLTLKGSEQLGENTYAFTYEYRIESEKAPKHVDGFEVTVIVEDGEAGNFSITELSDVDTYQECVEAGYQIMYPDCVGCVQYCATPDGKAFSAPITGQ